MIKINNFQIIDNGSKIAINLETNSGHNITSIKLWDYKDYGKETPTKDISLMIEGVNNKEVFIVSAEQLGLSIFEDIYFLEARSNYISDEACSDCAYPSMGVTYNLLKYYRCFLNYIMEESQECDYDLINYKPKEIVLNISMQLDAIDKAIEAGLYNESVILLNILKKLCGIKNCKNCTQINCSSCGKFKSY